MSTLRVFRGDQSQYQLTISDQALEGAGAHHLLQNPPKAKKPSSSHAAAPRDDWGIYFQIPDPKDNTDAVIPGYGTYGLGQPSSA